MITHTVYEKGKVQSLGFTMPDGRKATVGVLEAGSYNFGVAKRREEIEVITGELSLPGSNNMKWHPMTNDVLVFEEGQPIEFLAIDGTSYLCIYG